jgi:L-alanine-DL-glutamate epimerase-like enolase superfamily enzyme
MKIESIETIWHQDFPNVLFVLVHCDGLVGLGETYYHAEAVASYIHSVTAPLLVGQDATRISAINKSLEGYVGYSGSGVETRARSAIDIALWDLAGKRAGLPLHDLMGGRARDSIELYNTCAGTQYMRRNGQATRNYGRGVDGRWEDLDRFMTDAGELAEELLSEGIRGMKIWPFDAYAEMSNGMHLSAEQMSAGLEPIRKIREAVGDQMNVMIELHGLWSPATASSIIRSLEPYAPYWVEDPVRTDLIGALAEVHATASTTGTLIAVGETVAGGTGFMPLLSQRWHHPRHSYRCAGRVARACDCSARLHRSCSSHRSHSPVRSRSECTRAGNGSRHNANLVPGLRHRATADHRRKDPATGRSRPRNRTAARRPHTSWSVRAHVGRVAGLGLSRLPRDGQSLTTGR